ncbi:MAG: PEGA domain-containing protein [Methanoregula sp.]
MKKISFAIGILLLLLLLPCVVSALGNIAVSSSPSGAQIFVDSIDKGVTPLTVDNVTIGPHNVLLTKTGYLNYLSSVNVGDGETVILSVSLTTTASTPKISNISPSSASNNGLQTVVIAGTDFSGSTVSLTKSGQSTIIGAVVGTDTSTTIVRNFHLDGLASGIWDVLILNADGGTVTGKFTINSATTATITPISPTSATVTSTVPATTVTTVKTTVKSTVKAPTPWPSATTTPASPVSIVAILSAVGVGLIVLRKW